MKNNNLFNLTIDKILRLKVNKDRFDENKHMFYKTNLGIETYKISDSNNNGYNSFSIIISDKRICDIDFYSSYDMEKYIFNEFFCENLSRDDFEIQEKFLNIINSLLYTGVLYGDIRDITSRVVRGNHFGSRKLYSWACDLEEDIEVGDILVVETYSGEELIKVKSVENISSYNSLQLKKVKRKIPKSVLE